MDWKDLINELEAARRSYQEIRSLPSGPTDEDRASYEFVTWLSDVNDCMVRGDVPNALLIVQKMPVSPISGEHKPIILSHCLRVALSKVQRLLNEGKWPDELKKAQAIVEALQGLRSVYPEIAQHDELSEIENQLVEWQQKLNQFRGRLGLLDRKDNFENDVTQVLSGLGNHEVDKVLQEAIELDIEIFDRIGLSDEQAVRCRVKSLLAARHSDRLLERMEATLKRFSIVKEQWPRTQQLARELAKQSETLRVQLSTIETTMQMAHSQADKLKQVSDTLGLADNTLWLGIFNTWIAAGLQAVRELRLDGPGGAKDLLEQARSWATTVRPRDVQSKGAWELLSQSIKWLEAVYRDATIYTALKQWRTALHERNLPIAESEREKLICAATQRQDILSGWVVGELQSEHIALRLQEQAPQVSPADMPRDPKQTAFEKKAKELVSEWGQLIPQLRTSLVPSAQLKGPIEQTSELVKTVPADWPAHLWQDLTDKLPDAYNNLYDKLDQRDSQSLDYWKLCVWLGILRFKVHGPYDPVIQQQDHPSGTLPAR